MTDKTKSGKARGGDARARALTPEQRSEIAKKAAHARWDDEGVLQATHEGEFPLGNKTLACANLPNGQRIITQAAFLRALGRSPWPTAGTGVFSTLERLPTFLQAETIKPFVDDELSISSQPVFYRAKNGRRGVGYDATLLPKVAEVYLKYRDYCAIHDQEIPRNYKHIVAASDILIRGLAHVGIVALVDEATGYQKDRARAELAKILEAFVAKELQPWVRTFPNEFFEHLFRLRGLPYPSEGTKRPQYFGRLINNIIYRRLAPAVLDELKKRVAKDAKGRPKHKLHQFLTPDMGHPKIRDLLVSVITIEKLSITWDDFEDKLDRIHPAYGETRKLELEVRNDDE
jgi:hypothetical protein